MNVRAWKDGVGLSKAREQIANPVIIIQSSGPSHDVDWNMTLNSHFNQHYSCKWFNLKKSITYPYTTNESPAWASLVRPFCSIFVACTIVETSYRYGRKLFIGYQKDLKIIHASGENIFHFATFREFWFILNR